MNNSFYTLIRRWMSAVLLLLTVAACSDEPGVGVKGDGNGDKPVMICAAIGGMGIATRSGEGQVGEEEVIVSRTMLFTYPSYPDGEMASAKCVFDEAGYGYVYTKVETKEPLLWKNIYVKDKENNIVEAVYLDNLYNYPVQKAEKNPNFGQPDGQGGREYLQTDNFIMMYFGSQKPKVEGDALDNKYKRMIAPLGTPAAEEADIIWGKLEKVAYGTTLQFKLQHKMTAMAFRFYSEIEALQKALEEDGIRVWVDNLRIWMEDPDFEHKSQTKTFVRSTGEVYQNGFTSNQLIQKNVFWVKDSVLQADEAKTSFSTPAWVFPPYRGPFTGVRPVLYIDLGDDRVYYGQFPQIMNYWTYDNNQEKWVEHKAVDLELETGNLLTFNVKLLDKLEGRKIEFMTVEVSDMGLRLREKPVLGESGITSWDDLMALAKAYNNNPSETNYRLMRFGMWSKAERKWVFNLLRSIEVPAGTALPEFIDGNCKIDFRGYKIKVGDTVVTEQQLSKK